MKDNFFITTIKYSKEGFTVLDPTPRFMISELGRGGFNYKRPVLYTEIKILLTYIFFKFAIFASNMSDNIFSDVKFLSYLYLTYAHVGDSSLFTTPQVYSKKCFCSDCDLQDKTIGRVFD